ncbi:MAG: DUF5916 domain-containing protein [Pseudomonadales bacterium]
MVDGEIDADPAWEMAAVASDFVQSRPFLGAPATERTEVMVGYTADTLYIGARLFDSQPERIITGDSRRDSDINETDSFQMVLDGFLDRQNALFFGTSPAAVQFDAQVIKEGTSGGFNSDWDTSWEVQTRIHDWGWSLEMAIPFRVLRYGGGAKGTPQNWGINFQRTLQRKREISYWSPLDQQFGLTRISDAGTLSNLMVPRQRSLKATPYALARANRGGAQRGTDTDTEVGVDLKLTLTPSLTLDATYNTDFAQVEVDDLQVNLNRFSLFFPEKRAFFLENAGQFEVGSPEEAELFFSRRIGIGPGGIAQPIEGGLRLSGKVGAKTNVGLLRMQTEGTDSVTGNTYSVARINQELGARSALGAIYVERDGDASGDYNRTYAIDGRWGIGRYNNIEGYLAQSETPGRRGDDHAGRIRYNHASTDWTGALGYSKVGDNFNPEVGFLTRRNYEKADMVLLRRIRPANLWGLHELRPHIAYRGFFDDTGFYETGFIHVDNHWEWRNGAEIHTGVNFTHEGVKQAFEINEGTFVQPGEYDHSEADIKLWTNQGAAFSSRLDIRQGGFFGGDRTSLTSTFRWRPGETFSGELVWNHNDIDLPVANGEFKVNVASLRLSYSFTPKVLLQALVQHDDRSDLIATNLRFAWLQSANTGLYLVYNEIDDDAVTGPIKKRRELVIKYSRILDLF